MRINVREEMESLWHCWKSTALPRNIQSHMLCRERKMWKINDFSFLTKFDWSISLTNGKQVTIWTKTSLKYILSQVKKKNCNYTKNLSCCPSWQYKIWTSISVLKFSFSNTPETISRMEDNIVYRPIFLGDITLCNFSRFKSLKVVCAWCSC